MERRNFLKFGTGAVIGGALAACGGGGGGGGDGGPATPPPEPVRTKVVLGWNTVALNAVRAERSAPPVAARALAVVHTAMYNAWAVYDATAVATAPGPVARRPAAERTTANAVRAFSYAAYCTLLDQFPRQRAAINAHMALLGFSTVVNATDFSRPADVGAMAATILLARAHLDGANQLGNMTDSGIPFADYTRYAPTNAPLDLTTATAPGAIADPGHWQPLRFRDAGGVLRTQAYQLPYWGKVKPFALTSGAQFRPAPPAAFGSAAFASQARAIVATQAALTEAHKAMVEYWAGGATGELPSSYWSQFAQFISQRDGHNEDQDIKLFFALSNAVFDAGIAAWDAKLAYNSARPVTVVRHVLAGQAIQGYGAGPAGGITTMAGEAWLPFQPTGAPGPAHPDYVSGHSTYSMASAAVLRLFTGSDVFNHHVAIPARSMSYDPTLPTADMKLVWDTFTYAACEAGSSRVYGGIHFHDADVAGRALGEQVGTTAFEKARAYWLGKV